MVCLAAASAEGAATPEPPRAIALVYTDARSGVYMTADQLFPLVAYVKEGRAADTFFDGFLFLGIRAPSGGDYGTGTANEQDWSWFIDRVLGSGNQIRNLEEAAQRVSSRLGRRVVLKVIVTVPRPNPELSLSKRVEMVASYIDEVAARFNASGFEHLRLEGFYWMAETVYSEDEDLVKAFCEHVRSRGYRTYWIPYFTARGWDRWREFGFDYVMIQPNVAFYDVDPEPRFSQVDERVRQYSITVEMELPMYKGNPLFRDWRDPFVLYLWASLKYGWYKLAPLSYYYANAFYEMYVREGAFYDLLYKHVRGTLTFDDIRGMYEDFARYLERSARERFVAGLAAAGFLAALFILIGWIIARNLRKWRLSEASLDR